VTEPTSEAIDALVSELAHHGLGGLNPDRDQLHALLAAGRDGPLQFVNLLAYHEVAQYPAGHDLANNPSTGADAYARYGLVALDHVTSRGGRLTLYNDVEQLIIGRGDEKWDQIAIMEYPDTDAFLDMLTDPEYTAGLVHRDAGLSRTIVLVTRPLLPLSG
jgi:uncharacterized protein (DUF1330 family)